MRIRAIFFWAFVSTLGTNVFGQSNLPPSAAVPIPTSPVTEADLRNTVPVLSDRQIAQIARFQNETVSRVLGVSLKTDGVIPRVFRTRHPLHLINPLAPSEYGSGLDNVTTDPQTGQANGIRFLGLKF